MKQYYVVPYLQQNAFAYLYSIFISSPNWYNEVLLGIEIENIYIKILSISGPGLIVKAMA